MSTEIVEIEEKYGPRMAAINPLQRRMVVAYLNYPNWSKTACAIEAGYSQSGAATRASINFRDEAVILAINEEAGKRLRAAGGLAIGALTTILANPQHKDHLKAVQMTMDRTGFHAMSEHKVTVDDKRPETKQELIDAVLRVAQELGLSPDEAKKLTGAEVVDAEFVELDPEVESM